LPYLVTKTDVKEVVARWPAEWHAPSELAAGPSTCVESFVAPKRKEAAKQVACNLVAQKKNEAAKRARVEQERATKEEVKQENHKSQKGDKSPLPETEEEELSRQGGRGQEG